ncbi:glycosyltransferase family 4 protein [Frankia sp. AgB32]|uniref:glycosyltransferase family 4 protein n=1 Tax=Frankia sp. AgB32 TaxID=631119 RepID=UPI0020108BE8|nr:glycosyltransferase family 4 protein [Frankia sp. AgB32]MCK9895000.1 glycosyltransferase family 4 protein [Frankia sp. AgB32]
MDASPLAAWSEDVTPRRSLPALAGRHVVFLNWRDRAHPQAGGAELFCQSIAERFAAAGVRVTLLTSRPGEQGQPAALPAESVGGVDVRRGGGTFGVYPAVLARLASLGRAGHRVDAVVDCQNGIPFFSPLVLPASTPVVQVLHHVHQKQFPLYFPGPVARVGQLLEAPGSRLVYRRRPVAVVSPSTRDEARDVLGLPGARYLVPNGVVPHAIDPPGGDEPAGGAGRPAATPTIVCVGRLVPHKRLHLLLDAVPGLAAAHPGLVVHVVGDGPDRERLVAHAERLGLTTATGAGDGVVRWHGHVPADVRDRLLASAWLTVNPSHGEGWGLSVLEAAALGVPAVAFRVPGLRDAVRDGTTGWLVEDGVALEPAIDAALRELSDPVAAARLRAAARAWAGGFTWDASAELLARVVTAEIDRLAAPGGPDRDRRRLDDELTHAVFSLPPGVPLPTLRRTDLVYRPDPAGEEVVAVLYGAGAQATRAALARAGVAAEPRLRPATGEDLLVAACRALAPAPAVPARAAAGVTVD